MMDLLVIQIDGIHIKDDLMLLAAVGVDGVGSAILPAAWTTTPLAFPAAFWKGWMKSSPSAAWACLPNCAALWPAPTSSRT